MATVVISSVQLDKTSSTVIHYLTTHDSDTFDHLVRICMKATSRLYVNDEFGKKAFIETFLLEFLEPYRDMPRILLDSAAFDGHFRHLANRCRSRFLNKIRDTNRAHKRAVFVAYDDEYRYKPTSCPTKYVELPFSQCETTGIGRWQFDSYFNNRQEPDDAEFDAESLYCSGQRPL